MKQIQTYRLDAMLQMWPSILTLTMTLTLKFQGLIFNLINISKEKMVRLSRNEKQTYRLNIRPQMWPSTLTLAMTMTFSRTCLWPAMSGMDGLIVTKQQYNCQLNTWWHHQMETFSTLLALCVGNSPVTGVPRSPVNSPHKGQWRGALMFSLIYA